ncbi:putative HTH-type transcriptional regulator YybR [Actinomadura rubteroloni]|uniref:Putative HTH-type transcriptional regulator YybR n=1 Tax=Actinomadura rubteroloni TaxID=1926885 RepID=A0A2P4UKR3_9ACTN|nr:winged helix-turn-helix transcriptional regulator [Actinomadura rubteroloni]POM25579.1 putative HTH-type transcriptional regulator YybR [Actinomadura rubteroloni]
MEPRSYGQYCPTARALDLVGERWTLLLVRELLTGPKRFGDLQGALRGLGTGLLSARLKHLGRAGIVERTVLPQRVPAYALTGSGRELEPVVLALARWGLRWARDGRRADETVRAAWAALALRACLDPDAAAGVRAVYEIRTGEEVVHARVHAGAVTVADGPAQYPDVTLTTSAGVLADLAAGALTLRRALGTGRVTASGDDSALEVLPRLFRPPHR